MQPNMPGNFVLKAAVTGDKARVKEEALHVQLLNLCCVASSQPENQKDAAKSNPITSAFKASDQQGSFGMQNNQGRSIHVCPDAQGQVDREVSWHGHPVWQRHLVDMGN